MLIAGGEFDRDFLAGFYRDLTGIGLGSDRFTALGLRGSLQADWRQLEAGILTARRGVGGGGRTNQFIYRYQYSRRSREAEVSNI